MEADELHETRIELKAPVEEILMVNEALDVLAGKDPICADVVKMQYFVGMTFPDIAHALGLSLSTVERHWSFARTWLKNWIRKNR